MAKKEVKDWDGNTYYELERYLSDLTKEEIKTFKEALFLSKGKTNNELSLHLVQLGFTADEIVRLASNVRLFAEGNRSRVISCNTKRKISSKDRAVIQQINRIPNLFDTVKVRNDAVKQLIIRRVESKYGKDFLKREFGRNDYLPSTRVDNELYNTIKRRIDHLNSTIEGSYSYLGGRVWFEKELHDYLTFINDLDEAGVVDNLPSEFLEEVEKNICNNEDVKKLVDYKKYRKYDIDTLLNTDTPIDDIHPEFTSDLVLNAMNRDMNVWTNDITKAKAMCLIDEFYYACEQMGIALVGLKGIGQWGNTYAKIKSIMNQTVKALSHYNRLVNKQGFVMSVARSVIIEELNSAIVEKYCKRGNSVRWRFISRNDIEDKEPVSVKTKSKSKSSSKKELVFDSVEEMAEYFNKNGGDNEQ